MCVSYFEVLWCLLARLYFAFMGVLITVSSMIRCLSSSVGELSWGEESGFPFVLVMGGLFGGAVSVRCE